MAFIASATTRPGFLRRMAFTALEMLSALVTARTRIGEVERLTRQSDAELQARGTTRQDEIARIFGPRSHF